MTMVSLVSAALITWYAAMVFLISIIDRHVYYHLNSTSIAPCTDACQLSSSIHSRLAPVQVCYTIGWGLDDLFITVENETAIQTGTTYPEHFFCYDI